MSTDNWNICEGVGFEECFRRHYRPLCHFAYRYLKEVEAAEDVVQDVFTGLLEARKEFQDEEHLLRFLYVSVRNACLNQLKLKEIHAEVLEKVAPREEPSEDEFFAKVVRAEVYREIMAAIDELPHECGKVFRLACVDGLSNDEVAQKLETALGDSYRVATHIEQNDFSDPDLVWESNDEMGQLTSAFNKMKHATRENIAIKERLHREELERAELGKRFAAAQFQALKNQLNPHFLFNTLNTIARMARIEGAPTSEQMTLAVSNLLRYTLRTNDPLVPLAQEIKVVEDYMYIQQMRFGERVRYRLDCQADTAALVPVFLLQPLVENAVHHGLSGKEEGGAVCICVRQAPSGRLRISVNDTGGGMPPERLEAVRRAMVEGDNAQGIGLGNLGRRIAGMYADGWVQVYSRPGCGTSVIMEFGAPRELG